MNAATNSGGGVCPHCCVARNSSNSLLFPPPPVAPVADYRVFRNVMASAITGSFVGNVELEHLVRIRGYRYVKVEPEDNSNGLFCVHLSKNN